MRSEAGLTQEQLAHKSGLARTYIGSVETGNRNISLHAIWQLATALHASPRSFFPAVEPDPIEGTAKAPAHTGDKG